MKVIRTFASADELARAAAEEVAKTITARETTRLALAGGTTPRGTYQHLARLELPWGRVTVFFGDERCVPASDADSNYELARRALLQHVAPASVHRLPAELGPEAAAARYEPLVAAAPLDLVLLGIGPDGHTASLFPGNAALAATTYVAPVFGAPKPPPQRVTLTLRTLREARRVIVLVSGREKADAVRRALAGEVPAGMIPGAEWLVTRDAAPEGVSS